MKTLGPIALGLLLIRVATMYSVTKITGVKGQPCILAGILIGECFVLLEVQTFLLNRGEQELFLWILVNHQNTLEALFPWLRLVDLGWLSLVEAG